MMPLLFPFLADVGRNDIHIELVGDLRGCLESSDCVCAVKLDPRSDVVVHSSVINFKITI